MHSSDVILRPKDSAYLNTINNDWDYLWILLVFFQGEISIILLYIIVHRKSQLDFFFVFEKSIIFYYTPFSFCKVSIQRASNKGWHLTKKCIQEWMKLYQMNGGANWPQVQDARSIFSRVQSIKSQFDKWCHKTSNGLSLCVCPFNLSYFAPAAVVRRKGVWETLYYVLKLILACASY